MNLEEIKKSGLLEGYIVGVLSTKEVELVESHLAQYPELNSELKDIQRAFRAYGEVNGVKPRAEFKQELIKNISAKDSPSQPSGKKGNGGGNGPFFFPFLLIAALAVAGFIWALSNKTKLQEKGNTLSALQTEYDNYQLVCDSIATDNAELRAMMNTITNPGNRIIQMTPTGNFTATNLYLHTNAELQLNYIQALTLPSIGANQAFQLWSLKANQDPIPLTVFADAENTIIPVDFEEGTATYAITIEDAGGALAPNLENLIGTIGV